MDTATIGAAPITRLALPTAETLDAEDGDALSAAADVLIAGSEDAVEHQLAGEVFGRQARPVAERRAVFLGPDDPERVPLEPVGGLGPRLVGRGGRAGVCGVCGRVLGGYGGAGGAGVGAGSRAARSASARPGSGCVRGVRCTARV